MPKQSKWLGVYLAFLLALTAIVLWVTLQPQVQTYKYTEVISWFQQDMVQEYTLDMNSGKLTITRMKGLESGKQVEYRVPSVPYFIEDTRDYIMEYNKEHPKEIIVGEYNPPYEFPVWIQFVPMFLLVIILVIFWVILMRQSRGGGGNISAFGKARTRTGQEGRKVTLADVAGADEEKEELVEVIDFLRSPNKFNSLGARIPKGILLVGPPGTGKTLLARAIAGEADVQFFSISGSDFVEMYVGVGASRVRDLFEQAKKNAPSVVFIDEIDAVGRQRGAGLGGGHDEREQTLNQLLVEMDGFAENTGVIILAATNRRDILDPALLRPGRFDRQIAVGYPDAKGRGEILQVHSKNKPLGPDVDLPGIARGTIGFTGADLENLMNEAALLAARRNKKEITMLEIEESTKKVLMGPEKRSHIVTPKDRKLTAYHEAGHAICSYYSPTQDPVNEVTTIPRGQANGYMMRRPEEERRHMTRTYMYEDIVVTLGGRVAEQLILDDISTGASHDLKMATSTAHDMVTKYGFSEEIGPVVYDQEEQGQVFLGRDYGQTRTISEKVAAEIDGAVRKLIEKAYAQSMQIVTEHMEKMNKLVDYLMENEKIDGENFKKLMADGSPSLEKSSDPPKAPPQGPNRVLNRSGFNPPLPQS